MGRLGHSAKSRVIPEFKPINVGEVQKQTIAGNIAAIPQASQLASAINLFNRSEATKSLEASTPGATDVLKKGTEQLAAFIRGEIPKDVSDQVAQQSAERALGGGFGGSGAAKALTARDLGLTSLNLVQQGLSTAEQWLSGAQQLTQPGGYFDVSGMLVTPGQGLQIATEERNAQFQRDLLKAQVDAAPDPFMAALGQAFINQDEQNQQMIRGIISNAAGIAAKGALA